MRYVQGKYKTREGAAKRLAFERAMNPGEFARGDVPYRYVYGIELDTDGNWRVTKIREGKVS